MGKDIFFTEKKNKELLFGCARAVAIVFYRVI